MPSEQTLKYVRDALNKGFTQQQIKQVLIRAGYPETEVESSLASVKPVKKTVQERNRPDFQKPTPSGLTTPAYIVLLAGLMLISFVITLPVVFWAGFGRMGDFATYLLIIFIGLLLGGMLRWLLPPLVKSDTKAIFASLFMPLLSVSALAWVFDITKRIVTNAISPDQVSFQFVGDPHSAFLTTFAFYVCVNSFVFLWMLKKEDYANLRYFILGLPLYGVFFWIAVWFSRNLIKAALL